MKRTDTPGPVLSNVGPWYGRHAPNAPPMLRLDHGLNVLLKLGPWSMLRPLARVFAHSAILPSDRSCFTATVLFQRIVKDGKRLRGISEYLRISYVFCISI